MCDEVNMPLSCLYRRNVTVSLQVGPAFSDTQLLFSERNRPPFFHEEQTDKRFVAHSFLSSLSNLHFQFFSILHFMRTLLQTHKIYSFHIYNLNPIVASRNHRFFIYRPILKIFTSSSCSVSLCTDFLKNLNLT